MWTAFSNHLKIAFCISSGCRCLLLWILNNLHHLFTMNTTTRLHAARLWRRILQTESLDKELHTDYFTETDLKCLCKFCKCIRNHPFSPFCSQEGVEVRVARIFNTFGPRMHMNDGRVVSNFILQALQGEPLTVRIFTFLL